LETKGDIPSARSQHSSLLFKGKYMFIFGGTDEFSLLNDVYVLNIETKEWTKVITKGNSPSEAAVVSKPFRVNPAKREVVLYGNKMFLFSEKGNLHALDLESFEWMDIEVDDPLPQGRRFHTANIIGSKMFIVGGTNTLISTEILTLDLELFSSLYNSIPSLPSSALGDMDLLLNNPIFSDFKFIINHQNVQRIFPAHCNIMYVRWPYFRALFDSQMKESQEREMIIDDVSHDLFLEFLRFIYIGKANITKDNVFDLIILSSRYHLIQLENFCESMIGNLIDDENVNSILNLANSFNFTRLRSTCINYFTRNFKRLDGKNFRGFRRTTQERNSWNISIDSSIKCMASCCS